MRWALAVCVCDWALALALGAEVFLCCTVRRFSLQLIRFSLDSMCLKVKPCINERPLVMSWLSIKVRYSHSVYSVSDPLETQWDTVRHTHRPYANQYDSDLRIASDSDATRVPVSAYQPMECEERQSDRETNLTVIEIGSQCLHVFTLPNGFITYLLSLDLTLIACDTREPELECFYQPKTIYWCLLLSIAVTGGQSHAQTSSAQSDNIGSDRVLDSTQSPRLSLQSIGRKRRHVSIDKTVDRPIRHFISCSATITPSTVYTPDTD